MTPAIGCGSHCRPPPRRVGNPNGPSMIANAGSTCRTGACGAVPELVTTVPRLEAVVESALRRPVVAMDLESNGFFRYPERVCLVQLAVGGAVHLVDPLSLEHVAPLGALLAAASVEKVFHAADYDVRSLDREWGFRCRNLFDTGIAAAFVGSRRLGLAAVLKDHLGVEVDKSNKLQRADWTRRPLTAELLHYAAGDVRHLCRLRDVLHDKLDALGRIAWMREECVRQAAVRYRVPETEWAFLSVKGSRELDGRGLAVLRSLHAFREREALRRGRPPFRIFPDTAMTALAANPSLDFARVSGLGRYAHAPAASDLRRAVTEGIGMPPVKRPRAPSTIAEQLGEHERKTARTRLQHLRKWRTAQADRLGLDPGRVWPAASLERLSLWPGGFDDEMASAEVREWQRRELGGSLRGLTSRLRLSSAAT